MDAQQRTRSCTRQPRSRGQTTPHGSKQICIPMTPEAHLGGVPRQHGGRVSNANGGLPCLVRPWFVAGSGAEMVAKLCQRESEYAVAYAHPGCHRTSNLVDRLMNRLTRLLYSGRGLHGHQHSSASRLRGWALLHNFRPFAPRSGRPREYQSPAHRLNGKQYHEHWLHNLQVSTSLAGLRSRT